MLVESSSAHSLLSQGTHKQRITELQKAHSTHVEQLEGVIARLRIDEQELEEARHERDNAGQPFKHLAL